MNDSVTARLPHRADIDGLRAIAILPILMMHCGMGWLRGGFVGVDVFFVISGYLITAIISREMALGTFTLAGFYRRRIVRILPALMVMVAVTLILSARMMWPVRLRDLGQSVIATSLFSSNIYFYMTADYFAQASDAKPLVHTWSLAVEEQFYLAYPLVLGVLLRGPVARARWWIALLAGVSVLIGLGWGWVDSSAGFFLLPSRIWELMAGALVALGAVPQVRGRGLRSALSLGALGTIAASCVVISSGWPFPVPFALPAVLAAAALLALGPDSAGGRLLAWRPLRMVGLISYSIYLWHRPIIALYEIDHGGNWPWPVRLGLLATCLAAGLLSYLLVERPVLRRWRGAAGWGPQGLAAVGLLAMALAGYEVATHADILRPLPPDVRRVAAYLDWDSTPAGRQQFDTGHCFAVPTEADYAKGDCLTPSITRHNVLLIGDSHAAQLSQALREAMPRDHLLQATAAGCRPLLSGRGLASCRAVVAQAMALVADRRVDDVILAGRWLPMETPLLIATVRHLEADGARVTVVGPMVEYDVDMPALLASATLSGESGSLLDRHRLQDRLALDHDLAPLVRAAGAIYVSPAAWECPAGVCRRLVDGAPVHFDHSHLTPGAARGLVQALLAARQAYGVR